MKSIIALVFSILIYNYSNAQKDIAINHIQHLCSSKMAGRGYVDNGVLNAANYIDSCFSAYNLSKFESLDGYKQELTFSANTFPSNMEVMLGNITLTPGVDFIIEPQSKGITGNFECVTITKEDLTNNKPLPSLKGKVLIVDDRNPSDINKNKLQEINQALQYITFTKSDIIAVIELTNNKLTWSASTEVGQCPYIKVNTQKNLPLKIKDVTLNIKNKFIKKIKTSNLCGYVKGSEFPDSLIVFTAHYDHLGKMGANTVFRGANDNASGVSAILYLAEYFSKNPQKYSIAFIALTGEEIGLLGSFYMTNNPPFELRSIKFLLNLDLAGTGDNGIQIVNSTIFKHEAELIDSLNQTYKLLPQIKKRGEACNSDHCPFYMKGVPCFFIYTLGGIDAYHDIYDLPETLPLTEFNDYMKLLIYFVQNI